MPISKTGLRQFLERKMQSYDWVKAVSRGRMFREVRELAPGFKFKTRPFAHQLACFYLGIVLPEFLFLLDMGLGKSKIALDVFRFRRIADLQEGANRLLVVAPREINVAGWEEEIALHTDLRCVPLIGSSEVKLSLLNEDAEVFVCSYPGLVAMLCDNKGGKLVPRDSLIKKVCSMFGMVVLDEVHKAKSKKSLTFRVCNKVTKHVQYRYGLTGTAFGRNVEDLWAQFYLIDKGETLGSSLGMLRDAYFIHGYNDAGFPKWEFDKRKKRQLRRVLKNKSIRYQDREVQDLPPTREVVVPVTLSHDAKQYYMPAKKRLLEARGDFTQVEMNYTRLREICSGFLQWKDEDDPAAFITSKRKAKNVARFPTNPKLEALRGVLEDIPVRRKVIIAHWFLESGKMICELLQDMKIQHIWIRGGMRQGEATALSRKFKNDASVRVMVGNIDSVSHGGNFQGANYTIYFEEPDSPINKRQFDKRTHRTGAQASRYYYYYLLTQGTIEERIHQFLKEGKSLYQAVLEGTDDESYL